MDLWIRSQDRTTLIRSYEIYISEQQNTYLIRAKRTSHILGVYNTFERALEVLDEIQSRISKNEWLKNMMPKVTNIRGYEEQFGQLFKEMIYEMPKEWLDESNRFIK